MVLKICVWLLTSCFIVERLLNLSEPLFSSIKMQIKLAESLQGLNEIMNAKPLAHSWNITSRYFLKIALHILTICKLSNTVQFDFRHDFSQFQIFYYEFISALNFLLFKILIIHVKVIQVFIFSSSLLGCLLFDHFNANLKQCRSINFLKNIQVTLL